MREGLNAGMCDLVTAVPSGLDMIRETRPYYRSTYVFVSRAGEAAVSSFDDPNLKVRKVGVQMIGDDGMNSPPAHALAARGINRARLSCLRRLPQARSSRRHRPRGRRPRDRRRGGLGPRGGIFRPAPVAAARHHAALDPRHRPHPHGLRHYDGRAFSRTATWRRRSRRRSTISSLESIRRFGNGTPIVADEGSQQPAGCARLPEIRLSPHLRRFVVTQARSGQLRRRLDLGGGLEPDLPRLVCPG
ncbi:MAG TPA: hypothetical protein VJY34_18170 [Roseiarcus sp.]|nr:hypothetical protein [Roseiarcus sp.]